MMKWLQIKLLLLALCLGLLRSNASIVPSRHLLAPVTTVTTPVSTAPASVHAVGDPATSLYPQTPALFAFGDGDFDVGNVFFMGHDNTTGRYPYGKSYWNITGRESDGRILIDFFAESLGLPLLSPSLDPAASFYQGVSFANPSGNRFNFTTDATGYRGTPLLAQVDQFAQFKANATAYWATNNPSTSHPRYPRPEFFSEGIYIAHSGGNDLLYFHVNNYTYDQQPAYLQNMTNVYEQWARALYALGARKFILLNFGEFGCTPAAIVRNKGNCSANITAECSILADQTNLLAQQLQANLTNATFIVGNEYKFNVDVQTNPSQFGVSQWNQSCCGGGTPALANAQVQCNQLMSYIASNATGPAAFPVTICPDPSQYLWWDQVHMTEAMNRFLANDIFGGNNYVFPKNMVQAFILPQLLNLSP